MNKLIKYSHSLWFGGGATLNGIYCLITGYEEDVAAMGKYTCHSDESQNLTVVRCESVVIQCSSVIATPTARNHKLSCHSEALAEESLTKVAKESSLVVLTQNDGFMTK